jgi:uncharacterized membrane protein
LSERSSHAKYRREFSTASGFWNTFFTLTIIPDVDVQIMPVSTNRADSTSNFAIVIIAAVAVVAVAVVSMFFLAR